MDVVDGRGGGMVGIWGLKGMKVKRWEGDGGGGRRMRVGCSPGGKGTMLDLDTCSD